MMRHASSRLARLLARSLAGTALVAALSGCVDNFPDASVGRGDIRNAIARGQMASPRSATVALVSLEGAPDSVATQFRQALTSEAGNREITMTDVASARYLVRGYLAAYPSERGDTVAYVYDVFDAGQKLRTQRVNDAIEVPATSADPWGSVTPQIVASLAGRSADDLAVALAGTPEAQAGKVAAAGPAVGSSPVN